MGPETLVKCPVCGFDYTHPVAVEVYPFEATKRITIDNTGFDIDSTFQKPGTRGVGISVRFVGECSHAWTQTFQFHKGQTEVKVTRDADIPLGEMPPTIWRD